MGVDYCATAGYGFELTYELLEHLAKKKLDDIIKNEPEEFFEDYIDDYGNVNYEDWFHSVSLDDVLEDTEITYDAAGNAYSGDTNDYFLISPSNPEDLLPAIDEAIEMLKKYDIFVARKDFKFICEGYVC